MSFNFNFKDSGGSDSFKALFDPSDKKSRVNFNNMFPALNLEEDDKGKFKVSGETGLEVFLSDVNRMNENSFQNIVDRKIHNKAMFQEAIEHPVEFIKAKTNLYKDIKELADNIYKNFLNMLVGAKIPPGRAERIASQLGVRVFQTLEEILEKEVMPSPLEKIILDRQVQHATKKVKSDLGDVIEGKIERK